MHVHMIVRLHVHMLAMHLTASSNVRLHAYVCYTSKATCTYILCDRGELGSVWS